jgi:type IV pili sensor histidine kinase/response regulator
MRGGMDDMRNWPPRLSVKNMVKISYKLAASSVVVLTLGACASTPTLEFPSGNKSARIPLNVQMPAPQQLQPQPATKDTPGILAQPVTPAPANTEPVQTPGADPDMAKKLLAQDAAKVIGKPPAKAGATPTDKDKKPDAIAQQDDVKANTGKEEIVLPVKTELVKQATAQVKSDVVEVEPVVKVEPLPAWSAQAGTTLRQTIEGWSHKQGWDVRWESELLNYPIEETFSMIGEYLDVITRTFELYKDAKRPFKVEVYPSQKLVVVKEKK